MPRPIFAHPFWEDFERILSHPLSNLGWSHYVASKPRQVGTSRSSQNRTHDAYAKGLQKSTWPRYGTSKLYPA